MPPQNPTQKWLLRAALTAALLLPAAYAQDGPPPPPPPPAPRAHTALAELAGESSFLGVGTAEVSSERARALKLSEERGVEITLVEEDSPASKAGLKVGDVVLEYNGQRVEGTAQFVRLVRETPPGRQVKLLISREGKTMTLTATIGKRRGRLFMGYGPKGEGKTLRIEPPDFEIRIPEIRIPDIPRVYMSYRNAFLGIEAESLSSQLADFFGVKSGVLVRSVLKDSAAEKAGLKAGDVITKVDGAKVEEPRDITNALRSQEGKSVPLTVVRERKEMTVTVTLAPRREYRDRRPDVRTVRDKDEEML